MPLADAIRPRTLDEVCGQKHLLAKGAPLRRIIESGHVPSLIFYGPPGTGKTTLADILATITNKQFFRLNATTASLSDVKDALDASGTLAGIGGTLLYIDELQYFNKRQQQSLLEYMEDGRVTLVGSTTENPYFAIYGAILSRATVFEFRPLTPEDIMPALRRGMEYLCAEYGAKDCDDSVLSAIAGYSGGDVRKALTALENTYYASGSALDRETALQLTQRSGMRFDKDGNEHYDLLSAFQKSIRGSDENAAIFYLARLLEGGDLLSPCRRLLVIASEDIGLAYPQAAAITNACVESALKLGLPEAAIPLSEAVIMLATAPKSNSAYMAYANAKADIDAGRGAHVPTHLRDKTTPSDSVKAAKYIYPHGHPNNYVKQQYLPDDLTDRRYYTYGDNKQEKAAEEYWRRIKDK